MKILKHSHRSSSKSRTVVLINAVQFQLPTPSTVLKYCSLIPEAVSAALSNFTLKPSKRGGRYSDFLAEKSIQKGSFKYDFKFGTTIRQIQSQEDLQVAINANESIKSTNSIYGKKYQLEIFPIKEFFDEVMGKGYLLFHDTKYRGRGMFGVCFIALNHTGAVIMLWEMASNFCGGPYSERKCGRG